MANREPEPNEIVMMSPEHAQRVKQMVQNNEVVPLKRYYGQHLDIDVDEFIDDKTVLMYAAGLGRKEIVKLFLQEGANVNLRNNHGETALHYAAFVACLSFCLCFCVCVLCVLLQFCVFCICM